LEKLGSPRFGLLLSPSKILKPGLNWNHYRNGLRGHRLHCNHYRNGLFGHRLHCNHYRNGLFGHRLHCNRYPNGLCEHRLRGYRKIATNKLVLT
jgi:hypothetical protein